MARVKYKTIKERFRALREELNTYEKDCTQDMLSKQIYIQKPQISELENGKRLPSINELKAYSRFFNAPMEYLLGESDSRDYNNTMTTKELGLSDEVINALKLWKEKSPKCNIIYVLNQIFKLGYGYSFFNALSRYFYGECNKFLMSGKGFKMLTDNKVQIVGKDLSKSTTLTNKGVERIYQYELYDLLSEIKKQLKENKFECESEMYNGFDTNACLSEHYNDLDEIINDKDFAEYINSIRRNTNGLHSTTKTKKRQNLVHNKGSKRKGQ